MDKTKPTREQIKAALKTIDRDDILAKDFIWEKAKIVADAYRATQRPAAIIGRAIGYVIAAALGVLALAGLIAAVKVLVGVVG